MNALLMIIILTLSSAYAVNCDEFRTGLPALLHTLRTNPENVEFGDIQELEASFSSCDIKFEDVGTTRMEVKQLHGKVLVQQIPKIFDSIRTKGKHSSRDTIIIVRNFLIQDNLYNSEWEQQFLSISNDLEKRILQLESDRRAHVQESCRTPRDLSQRLPPVRDQGSIGWCYSHAAADLVFLETGIDVSPLDIALNYIEKTNSTPDFNNDGGLIAEAIRACEGRGFCPSSEMDYSQTKTEDLRSALKALTEIESLGEGFVSDDTQICEWQASLSNIYKDLSIDQLKDILLRVATDDLVDELRKTSCEARATLTRPLEFNVDWFPDNEYQKDFEDEVLTVLENDKAVGVEFQDLRFLGINTERGKGHAMTIVGNVFNEETRQCDFIIRNSWGKDCMFQPVAANCKDGYWHIPSSVLKEQRIRTITVKPAMN